MSKQPPLSAGSRPHPPVEEKSSSQRLSFPKRLVFSVLPVLLVLGVLEGSLRVLKVPSSERTTLVDELTFPPPELLGTAFEFDDRRFWRLAASYDGPWLLFKNKFTHERNLSRYELAQRDMQFQTSDEYRNVTWRVNSQGFRGPVDHSNRSTVLFLGSSVTFGWGVQSGQSFPSIIGRKLIENGRSDWRIINAGVPGYSSFQCRKYLEEILLDREFAPRILIVEVGINDGVFAPGHSDKELDAVAHPNWANHVINYSKVLTACRSWIDFDRNSFPVLSAPVPKPEDRFYYTSMFLSDHVRVPESDFRENIAAIEQLARENDAEMFLLFPGLFNEYGEKSLVKAVQVSHPREIPMVDTLNSAFSTKLAEAFLPFDEAHLSAKGHEVVAERIWRELNDRRAFHDSSDRNTAPPAIAHSQMGSDRGQRVGHTVSKQTGGRRRHCDSSGGEQARVRIPDRTIEAAPQRQYEPERARHPGLS